MPRGYELNYYDTFRAIQRKIYSNEIRRFSGILKECKFNSVKVYEHTIAKINEGLYQSLDKMYYRTQKVDNPKEYIGFNKSSYNQDFMSPMELRMNSMAVRKAINNLLGTKNLERLSLSEIESICKMSGQSVANEFNAMIEGEEELNMKVEKPVLSTKPIIKKYNEKISIGRIPAWKTYTYAPEKAEEREKYINLNKEMFFRIKEQLLSFGFANPTLRQNAFGKLNEGYYDIDKGDSYFYEITKILITDKMYEYVSLTELKMNYEKLFNAYETLKAIPTNVENFVIFRELKKSGSKTRQLVLKEYKQLPELFGGFYCTYADSDKRITLNKESIKNQNKQKEHILNGK